MQHFLVKSKTIVSFLLIHSIYKKLKFAKL